MSAKGGNTADVAIGSRVVTGKGLAQKGEVKFIGETQFKEGVWIGIRLDEPEGKNDGSIEGVRYFDCDPNHGIFVRQGQAMIDPNPPTASAAVRDRLGMLREKRNNLLKEAGASATSAARSKLVKPTTNLGATTSSVTSTSSGGSATSPTTVPTTRSTRASLLPSAGGTAAAPPSTPMQTTTRSSIATAAPTAAAATRRMSMTKSQAALLTPAPSRRPAAGGSLQTPAPTTRTERSTAVPTLRSSQQQPQQARETATPSPAPSTGSQEAQEPQSLPQEEGKKEEEFQESAEPPQDEAQPLEGDAEATEGAEEEDEEEAVAPYADDEEGALPGALSHATESEPVAESAHTPTAEEASTVEETAPSASAAELESGTISGTSASPAPFEAEPLVLPTPDSTAPSTPAPPAAQSALPAPATPIATAPSPAPAPVPVPAPVMSTPVPSTAAAQVGSAVATPAPTTPVAATATITTTTTTTPAQPKGGAAAAYTTPLKDASLRRFPSSRSNSMVPGSTPAGGADGGAPTPTPSKDAALIQFMQTSIYKLNQEKDELTDKVAALNAEVVQLNTHVHQSNDLVVTLQEEVDREAAEMKALRAELAAARQSHEQALAEAASQAAALRQRIHVLENTPPPKDPRVAELEGEVDKLNHAVEALALEKEALLEQQELLDEKYLQAQIDLEEALAEVQTLTSLREAQASVAASNTVATAADDGGDAQQALQSARAECDKLREALRRLNASAAQDKATLTSQTSRLATLETEVTDLRAFRAQAEEDLQALQGTVDSMASFESMIEKLSEENLDLAERLKESQEVVRDLEDAAELAEEIDQQQRRQIDADRSAIDMLNVAVGAAEQRLAERDKALQDQAGLLQKVKSANKTLKAEIARLQTQLSSDSQESQQLEAKLRELAYLRSNQEVLAGELHTVYQAQGAAVAQKQKYQALYTRMDAIFGGIAVFIEESKQISTEIAVVSTAAAGMEACRGLSAVLDEILQAQQAAAEGSEGVHAALDWDALALDSTEDAPQPQSERVVPLLATLHALLVQAEAYAVQSCLEHFRPTAAGERVAGGLPARAVQRLIDLKARFETVAHLAGRMRVAVTAVVAEWRSHVAAAASSLALASAAAAGGDGDALDASFNSVGGATAGSVDFVPTDASSLLVRQLLQDLAAATRDLAAQMTPSLDGSDLLHILQNITLLESYGGSVNAVLKLETLYISLNTLCDVGVYQLEHSAPGTAAEDHLLLALRSMKADLKASVLSFKMNAQHYLDKLPDIQGNYQLLVSCFTHAEGAGLVLNSTAEATEGVVRMVQNFLRKLSSGSGTQGATAATQQLILGGSSVMRFFPFSVLSNTVPVADPALRGQLREQFEQHVSRYWTLCIHTHSDLLLPVAGAGGGAASAYTEVSWRPRVADARNLIQEKYGAVGTSTAEAEAVEVASPGGGAMLSPSKAGSAAANKLQALTRELEVKREELRAAMERCEDLQAQLDTALATAPATEAGDTSTSKGGKTRGGGKKRSDAPKQVPELLEEIATLEEALFATEQRVEVLEQEGKTLKAQLAQGAAGAGGGGGSAASQGKEGTGPASGISWDFKHLASKRAQPSSNGVSQAQYQAVLEQTTHWKQLALKRLTASLLPLPPIQALPATSVRLASGTEEAAQPKETAGPAQMKLTFKHIELVGGGATDSATLYHQLRMARASGARIRDCSRQLAGEGWTQEEGAAAAPGQGERRRVKSNLMYRIVF